MGEGRTGAGTDSTVVPFDGSAVVFGPSLLARCKPTYLVRTIRLDTAIMALSVRLRAASSLVARSRAVTRQVRATAPKTHGTFACAAPLQRTL